MPKLSKATCLVKLENALNTALELRQKNLRVSDVDFIKWKRDSEVDLIYIFGSDSRQHSEFAQINYRPSVVMGGDSSLYVMAIRRGFDSAEAILRSMIREISEYWDDDTDSDLAIQISSDSVSGYDRVRLLWDMTTHFNAEEIETICFELGIDHDSLRGDEKTSKIRELILYCERNDKEAALIKACSRHRPRVAWLK